MMTERSGLGRLRPRKAGAGTHGHGAVCYVTGQAPPIAYPSPRRMQILQSGIPGIKLDREE